MIRPWGTTGNKTSACTSEGLRQLPPAVLGGARALAKPVKELSSEGAQLSCLMSWRAEKSTSMPGPSMALMVRMRQ